MRRMTGRCSLSTSKALTIFTCTFTDYLPWIDVPGWFRFALHESRWDFLLDLSGDGKDLPGPKVEVGTEGSNCEIFWHQVHAWQFFPVRYPELGAGCHS